MCLNFFILALLFAPIFSLGGFAQELPLLDREVQDALADQIAPTRDDYSELTVHFHIDSIVYFVGFLMAQEEGYYKQADLPPIKFQWYDEKTNTLAKLRSGQVQFTTNRLPRVYHYACRGSGVVAISLLTHRSMLGVLVRKDLFPNVKKLQSLNNYEDRFVFSFAGRADRRRKEFRTDERFDLFCRRGKFPFAQRGD